MKIAIPLTNGILSAHFGHCEQFALVEIDKDSRHVLEQTLVVPPPHEPGLLPRWLHDLGVQMIIAGGMGRHALNLFAENGIAVHSGAAGESTDNLIKAFLDETLSNEAPSCGHDHDDGHTHCA
ncbi:MAG: NifB/NifX family molybdenum-iron cluster-binding protein [Opitutales bacterium]|jgi:predicted Fe-Mo cluster-binding NifX family protein